MSIAISNYKPSIGVVEFLNNEPNSLDSSVVTRNVQRGEYFYLPNSTTEKVYYLESGRIKLGFIDEEGKEVLQDMLSSGQIFGEQGLSNETHRKEFAKALDNATVRIIRLSYLRELMAQKPDLTQKIIALINEKHYKMQERWRSQTRTHSKVRIIYFMIDLAKQHGRKVGTEMLVLNFFTHQELADLVGSSRQTVTMLLNDLKSRNLIYFDRKRLLIRNMELLAKECYSV
ncbi:MAG: Crp/Fnr family transcriptional regulator [Sphingobacteriales bacterium]|nr:Crp/Fnr family transcriptional regulator [Sphingobacteriales bacterium]